MKYFVMAYDENSYSWIGGEGEAFETLDEAKNFAESWHYEDSYVVSILAVKDMYELHKKWVKKG